MNDWKLVVNIPLYEEKMNKYLDYQVHSITFVLNNKQLVAQLLVNQFYQTKFIRNKK